MGLVAAFLLLGSTRIEPLDFWWAPFDGWMIAAYLIILVGGLLITARLHLLGMSAAFWLTLAVGIGVLAASGHCMTARWSFEPVCGAHFWWVIVLSPEILIFLFFMITDPKTTPAGRVARVVFGMRRRDGVHVADRAADDRVRRQGRTAVGSGRAVRGAPVLRAFPARRRTPSATGWAPSLNGLARSADGYPTPGRALGRGAIVGATVVLLGAAVVAAGAPARESSAHARSRRGVPRRTAPPLDVHVDPSTLPPVAVDPDVIDRGDLSNADAQALAVTLAENLEVEARR